MNLASILNDEQPKLEEIKEHHSSVRLLRGPGEAVAKSSFRHRCLLEEAATEFLGVRTSPPLSKCFWCNKVDLRSKLKVSQSPHE